MSNSKLVTYKYSFKNYNERKSSYNPTGAVTKITIHHMCGNLSPESFYSSLNERGGSSNYAIFSDGKIGLFLDETKRSWCSSSRDNDYKAITIECANSTMSPTYEVSKETYDSLINLCVDICKRNGINSLNYTGDKTGNLTEHRMFTATDCPGRYLHNKMSQIAEEVNKQLSAKTEVKTSDTEAKTSGFLVKVIDDSLNIRAGAGTNYKIAGCIKNHGIYTITEVKGIFGKSGSWGKLKSGVGWISLYSGYVKKV